MRAEERSRDHDASADAFDPQDVAPLPGSAPTQIRLADFPRGAKAGSFFHDVLEHYDFASPRPDALSKLVESRFKEQVAEQVKGFGAIFASVAFWRIALALTVCHAGYLTLQGLWLGPWLYDVAGETRQGVANYLFATALAYMVGSIFFGVSADRLAHRFSRMAMYKLGLSLSVAAFILIAAGVTRGLWLLLPVFGFTAISAALAYAVLTPLFPPALTGRLSVASNVMMFGFAFAFQWFVGAVLRLYPVTESSYSPEGYSAALGILAALQLATLAWLLPMRLPAEGAPKGA